MRRKLHHAAVGAQAFAGLRSMALPLLVVALVGGGGLDRILFFGVVGIIGSVVIAAIEWNTTYWRLDPSAIRLKTGILSERIVAIPFDRVQAIDTVRGPFQRLFGVVELHVQSAGGGKGGEIVLKAVTTAEEAELRAAVGGERAAEEAVAAAPEPEVLAVQRLSPRALLVASLTSGSLGVLVPIVAGLSQVADDVLGREDAERLVPGSPGEAAMLAGAVLLAAWVLSVLGTVVAFAGFRATREGDRIRIERGIVERRAASIPVARIHAIRVVESLLREPLRLAQVRVETAGYAQEAASAQTLIPIARRRDVARLVAELLPELAVSLDGLEAPPPRALRRYVVPPLLAGAVLAAAALAVLGADALPALVLPAAGALLGVGRHRAAGWRLGDSLVLRGRRLARTTAIADPRRLQRVTGQQSLLQRRAALANLEVAVSSGRELGVRHLDRATVDDLVGRLGSAATSPP